MPLRFICICTATRIMKIRSLFILITLTCIAGIQAQTKTLLKAREAYTAGKYPSARKSCIKGLDDNKSITELWYIKAICEYEMYQIDKYRKESTDYFKEAVKSAVKAKNYDDNAVFYKQYGVRLLPLVLANNKEAISNYGQGRYPRAVQMYKNSYELTSDTIALGMMGHCYYLMRNSLDAVNTMRTVAIMNFGANAEGKHLKTFVREAFEVLTEHYLVERNLPDSARLYCEMGLDVFPLNIKLLNWERQMVNQELAVVKANSGYSFMFNQWITKALNYFPNDTFYLHQQNAYYLSRITHLTQTNQFLDAESIHQEFVGRKKNLVSILAKNNTDPFLTGDSFTFIGNGLDYFLGHNLQEGTIFYFYKWYPLQFKSRPIDEKLLGDLISNPPKSVSKRLIGMLANHAGKVYPKSLLIKKYRLELFNHWVKEPIHFYDWDRIISLSDTVIKDFPMNKVLKPLQQSLLAMACDSLLKQGYTKLAWVYYYRLTKENPKAIGLVALQSRFAKSDFEKRFKGSKITYATIKGKKIAQTGWTGNSKNCFTGMIPDTTSTKITDRINYFRQNAGIVNPIALNTEKQIACLEAAIVYSPLGIFSHEPKPETHKCFTQAAADAAKFGQAVLESNPAQSVTVFMSDDKSDELYNRRLITHPGMANYGFGCAENNSVFWMASNDFSAIDSAYYKDHFVAWPPAGASPVMLLFDKWSFSILQPLTDATVAIVSKKFGKIETDSRAENGNALGLPTLIIFPLGMIQWEAGDEIITTITLKNKKVYSYTTQLF